MAMLRIIMLFALIIALPLLGMAESFFVTRRGIAVSAAASIVLCPLAAVAALAAPCACTGACDLSCLCPALIINSAAWGLSGVGYAFFMVYWVWFLLALHGTKQRSLAIAAIMVVSAVVFLLMTLLQPAPSLVFHALLPTVSVALSVRAHKLIAQKNSSITVKDEDIAKIRSTGRRMRLSRKTVAMTLFSGLALGFCGFTITTSAFARTTDLLLSALLIAVGIAFLLAVRKRGAYNEDLYIRLYVPVVAFCLIPMSMADGLPRAVLACSLIAMLTAYSFIDLHVFVNDISLVMPHLTRVMALGRIGNVAGLAIGWLAGLAFCGVLSEGAEAFQRVCLALVLALIAGSAYMFHGPEYNVFPAIIERPEADCYEARCRRFAAEHGLTPRQLEVLALLGRGRTAKTIQEKLVVSESTAKTHIYNIYQKAGVHTQQELIEMLDAVEIAPEDFADADAE